MAQFRTSRRFDVLFLLVLGVLLAVAAINRVAIGDWVYFLHYTPTAQTLQVAGDAGLSPLGTHLLERANPQFDDLATINANCQVEHLGCLSTHDEAFILADPTKPDQTTVTAAHEMLHLAYQRLSQNEKDRLAPLIDDAINRNLINGLQDELANENTLADKRDEAHSLLGTEYKNVPTELEAYYSQYFTDRTKVLAAYMRSQQ